MNFYSYILNKLKKENHDTDITRFGDYIVIPNRDYFKDAEKIKLLEKYKKYYLNKLNQTNLLSILKFNSNTLKQNMNMNLDLIFRILTDNNDFYNYASEELMIQSLKLEMYFKEISTLEEEMILRLIALKEILQNKKIPNRNKITLEEEINQLSVILQKYLNRKNAIIIELQKYNDSLTENKNLTNELSNIDSNNEIFKRRLGNLLIISNGIYDIEEIKKHKDIKVKIAILERECEKYTYLNKDKIEKLKEELNELSKIEIDDNNFNELKNKCTKLENKLLLFYYYGKNLISENDLRKLYEFKFKILTQDIYSQKESPINPNDNGLPYYKEIIQQKLELILRCYNTNFIYEFSPLKIIDILHKFLKFYLNELNKFDFDEILSNKLKLSLLLAFDTHDGLSKFYENTKISETDYKNNLNNLSNEYITFEENASILALFEFSDLEKSDELLYLIYKNSYVPGYEEKNIFPEGISHLTIDEKWTFMVTGLRDKFRKIFDIDTIYIPSTMKTLNLSDLLISTKPKRIIFEDGIKELSINYCDGLELVLPPSLSKLEILEDKDHINRINDLNLTFYNYEDSSLLHSPEEITGNLLDYTTKYRKVKINDGYYGKDRIVTVKPIFSTLKLLSKNEPKGNFTHATTKPSTVFSACEKHAKTIFIPSEELLTKKSKILECKKNMLNEFIKLLYTRTGYTLIPELVESKEEKPKKLVK